MAVVWLVYILLLLIFFVVGWACVFHAKRYGIIGDLAGKAIVIYIILMLSIIIVSVFIVLQNGASAPLNLQDIRINVSK